MEQRTLPKGETGSQQMYTPSSDERALGILAHALTFVSTFLAPLVIYLIKKDESTFIAENAKESLNFQITVFIVCVILVVTLIGVLLLWAVGLAALVLVIVASVKASEGKIYRYPFTIRFIK